MENFDCKSRIREWSRKQIECLSESEKEELPPEIRESSYLGGPGATEEQIAAAEARLGVTFPPSYREFLTNSNGLHSPSNNGFYFEFYPTEEVDWYVLTAPDFVDEIREIFSEPVTDKEYFVYGSEIQYDLKFRPEYLQTALQISYEENGVVFLLNPQIVFSESGEWEAWCCNFSTAFGIFRYRSFAEMMEQLIFNAPEFPL
ncbi:MAG: SMI1/KNR4 family protein [Microcoleus sp. PH2017_10_PVI_O_A]|nr:SMI1/KNR4 family protein [Microcoleus sp. PH2017_10_PVI_O_A]MCC3460649.1 SMI1/KNR4 family protein [Microcoleus sp. PH2017_11_PCY_U_A]MCC3479196.1 SMI1/KNR4 family protein [Microcoleus sp. PH2017_12_PCY_D_A]MCC3560037.1 SMI1/KNR4 family protein [Microcoleus sp. PH2017_27_LUM_O_A]TAE82581.1 MAG: SMI1/KNR4 family protein [Oscillatoriales cyanobacterium]